MMSGDVPSLPEGFHVDPRPYTPFDVSGADWRWLNDIATDPDMWDIQVKGVQNVSRPEET